MTGPVSATGAASPAATAQSGERAKMQKVAKQFEAVFMRQMIGSMRSADLADGAFDSSATDQFRDMADSKTADNMAETGGFGIAQLMMRQFDQKAGHAQNSPANTPNPPANTIVTLPEIDSGK